MTKPIFVRAWDCETQTHEMWGQKASPWHPDNYVVCDAWVDSGFARGEAHYRYNTGRPSDGWLGLVLDNVRIVAGFNPKFDLMHAMVGQPQNQEHFRLFLAGGGMLWDCQLAEFLLNGQGQAHSTLSLDEVSVRYGGQLKHDEVKALWEAGVQTSDIPEPLLARYLKGAVNPETKEFEPGDVQNTMTVFNGQWAKAKQMGMLPLLIMNMRAYAYAVMCKLWGIHCDSTIGKAHAAELEAEIAVLHAKLSEHVKGLPFEFNWGSPKQRSALLFGGTIPYDATEYLGTVRDDPRDPASAAEVWWCPERDGEKPAGWAQSYTPKELPAYKLATGGAISVAEYEDLPASIEVAFERWVESASPSGDVDELMAQFVQACPEVRPKLDLNKGGKNAGQPKTTKLKVPDLDKPKKRATKVEHKMPRMVQPRNEWAGSEPGIWSTSSEVVEALEHSGVEFLKLFATWQKQQKDLGTYYISEDPKRPGVFKGMLTLVAQATSLIHGELSMVTAITGRLSSSRPNLQNLPREGTSRVKQMFTSRWGPTGAILQDDFSSLEVYVQANLTRCRALLDDLRSGLDLHCVRLSAWKEITYDEAYGMAKGPGKTPEGEELRTHAKVFSFRRAYGAGAQTIADGTGMAVETVEELIEAENKRWPGIDPYYEALTQDIKHNRVPGGRFLPHPAKPTVMCQLGTSHTRTPDGKMYVYSEHPSPDWMATRKHNPVYTSFSPTEIRNYVVQGGGAEVAKCAMGLIVYEWARVPDLWYKAPIINQVHDAFYVDAHPSVKARAAAVLHACVLESSTVIKRKLGWNIDIDYPAEIKWGPSMADETDVPAEVLARVPAIRERIRATL
jgi:DNA polymerase-1